MMLDVCDDDYVDGSCAFSQEIQCKIFLGTLLEILQRVQDGGQEKCETGFPSVKTFRDKGRVD